MLVEHQGVRAREGHSQPQRCARLCGGGKTGGRGAPKQPGAGRETSNHGEPKQPREDGCHLPESPCVGQSGDWNPADTSSHGKKNTVPRGWPPPSTL